MCQNLSAIHPILNFKKENIFLTLVSPEEEKQMQGHFHTETWNTLKSIVTLKSMV